MLIKTSTLEKIISGEVSILFRNWKRAAVKTGGTQMTQLGIIAIDAADLVEMSQISKSDIENSEFDTKEKLLAQFGQTTARLYRINVHFIGQDPRITLRNKKDLNKEEISEITKELEKMDRSSKIGRWTTKVLALIDENPATVSGELAQTLGLEKAKFKLMVRKLKALGLTESLDVGYRLSPRGDAFVKSLHSRSA